MHKIIIVTESSNEFDYEYIEANQDILKVIPCPICLKDKEFDDLAGKNYSHKDFYTDMRNGSIPKTSLVTPDKFEKTFIEYLNQGYDILYIGFSSALSSTFNSVNLAKRSIADDTEINTDTRIKIVDTKSASVGMNILLQKAIDMVKSDFSIDQIESEILKLAPKISHWFSVNDLNFLKAGGRISALTAVVGSALNIKPILTVNDEGKLVPFHNVRGRKKAINYLASKFEEEYDREIGSKIYIAHGDALEDAMTLKNEIIEKNIGPNLISINLINATIGSHVGPEMLAIGFIGKEKL